MMSADRAEKVAHGKGMLLSTDSLREMRGRGEIYSFGSPEEMVVDVGAMEAEEAAGTIAGHVRKLTSIFGGED